MGLGDFVELREEYPRACPFNPRPGRTEGLPADDGPPAAPPSENELAFRRRIGSLETDFRTEAGLGRRPPPPSGRFRTGAPTPLR